MVLRKSTPKPDNADTQLDRLCNALGKSVGAVKGKALSREAITVDGKIVAFISKGRLVVKLPSDRIAALLESGEATPMRMGTRVMKQWLSVAYSTAARWVELAEESARYVAVAPPAKKRTKPTRR